MTFYNKLSSKISRLFILLITGLITSLRPIIGYAGCCKFELSCTQYAKQALHQYTWYKACWLILKRFLSCW